MIEKVCSRSGLTFTTDNKRLKVHPKISIWTAHRDPEIRAIAVSVIDKGKQEGWTTLEKFQAEIDTALNGEPEVPEGALLNLRQASRLGGYEKPWVALITGQSDQYGYDRQFQSPYESTEGKTWRYALSQDGVYEACDRNSKGQERRFWIKVEQGSLVKISEEEAHHLVGPPAEVKPIPSSPLLRPSDSSNVVEVCWECGAEYTTYGNVESGNMGCIRCS